MLKRFRGMVKKAIPRRYGLPDFGNPVLPAGVELFDIRDADGLQTHAEAWDRLFAETAPVTPFLSRSWMEAFFKHVVHPPERWCCLFLYEAGRLTGVLPLVAGYAFVLPGLRLQLFKLPYHLMHTGGTDMLVMPGCEERVMTHFLRYLGGRRGLWPFLSYKHLSVNDPGARLFAGGDFAGMCAVRKPAGFESYIPVAGSGEEYTAGLAGKFRQNLRRAAAAFEALPGAEFVFCDRVRPVDELFDRFLAAEDQCWKGERGSSVKASPDSAAMMREAAAGLAAAGELAMSFLEVGGKVAAAHYAMRHGRVLYILKMGYDDAYAVCSPGTLLMHKVIKAAFDSGEFDEINLFSNPPHLARWNTRPRPLVHLIVFPRVPLLASLLRRLIGSGKVHNFDIPR